MDKVLFTTLSKLIVKEVPSGSLSVFLPHGTWTMVIQEWWAAGQTVNQMKGTQSSARVRCRYAFLEVSSFRSSLFLLATSTSTSTSNSSPNRLSSKSALKVRAIVIARVRCRFFNYSRPRDDEWFDPVAENYHGTHVAVSSFDNTFAYFEYTLLVSLSIDDLPCHFILNCNIRARLLPGAEMMRGW